MYGGIAKNAVTSGSQLRENESRAGQTPGPAAASLRIHDAGGHRNGRSQRLRKCHNLMRKNIKCQLLFHSRDDIISIYTKIFEER